MKRTFLLGLLCACIALIADNGVAVAACPVPNTLTNGTTADATQVMTNFNSIASCATDASNVTSGDLASARMTTNLSAALDGAFGSTQGSVLYRGASAWTALGPGTSGFVLSTNGAGANPSWVAQSGGGGGDFSLVSSVNIGTANSFTITGLNTTTYDYRLAIRMTRASGGAASSDYIQVQFGDATLPTPTLFTTTIFMNASGANSGSLTSTSGVANVAQVQNNSTLYMGTTLDMQFSADGLVVSSLSHSYFWENIVQMDQGPNGSAIGSIKVTMPNQSWNVTYSLWQIKR